MTPKPSGLAFGPFVLDENSGQLWKHGTRIRLQGQPLHILATLLRHQGEVVTRDEFQKQLWKGDTFVDFEHGLNAAVNRLRQALGDSADQPRYVETVPGRGYRFLAPVHPMASPVVENAKPVLLTSAPSPAATPQPPTAPGKFPWALAGGLAVAVAVAVAAYFVSLRPLRQQPAPPPLRFAISPPTGYFLRPTGGRQSFALSPDGGRLAFSAMDAGGTFRTFVRDLSSSESRPLVSGSSNLFWPPDGRSLFTMTSGKLQRNSVDGDSFQELCDLPANTITGTVIGPDVLIAARLASFTVPVLGGTPQLAKDHRPWPQILPDEKHLLYTVFDAKAGHHRVGVMELGKPETARGLLETDSRAIYAPSILNPGTGHLFSVRAGNLLAFPFDPKSLKILGEPLAVASQVYSFFPSASADFSVARNGMLAYQRYLSQSQLAWVNRRGEIVRTLGPANVNVGRPRVSPDGKLIAAAIFNVQRGINQLWIFDAATGTARRMEERGTVFGTVWSPDSSKLAFGLAYDLPPKMFLRGLGERDVSEPLPPQHFQQPTDWSSSGRYLSWSNTPSSQLAKESKGEFWVTDMSRDRRVTRLSNPGHNEGEQMFSPDGKWVAFISDQSGRSEVYIQAFEDGAEPRLVGPRHSVSSHGGTSIRWRSDGKELFYSAGDGKLYAVPVTLTPKLHTGLPIPLFLISPDARAALHYAFGFDVSKDGQQFLVSAVPSPERSEIIVLQNWEKAIQIQSLQPRK